MAFYNPFRPAYLEDPYPSLALLRKQEPVHRSADLDAWVVTSYDLCTQVLRDDETFSSDPLSAGGTRAESISVTRAAVPLGHVPVLGNSDGASHARLRGFVSRAFTPRAIAGRRTDVEAAIDALLDDVPGSELDVLPMLAEPLAVNVALIQVGIPEADRLEFRAFSSAIMRARAEGVANPSVLAEAEAAHGQLVAYLRAKQANVDALPPSVLRSLLEAAATGEGVTLEETAMLLIHISLAGNGATALAMANMIAVLASRPDAFAQLRATPALIPSAVEELLRFETPTHMITRWATATARLGGRTIRKGDTIFIVLAAANRDPTQFRDPDTLDLARADNYHLAFGTSVHVCLGAPVARIEFEVLLSTITTRAREVSLKTLERLPNLLLRGPSRLVVEAR